MAAQVWGLRSDLNVYLHFCLIFVNVSKKNLLPFKCGCIRSLQPSGNGYLSGFEFVFGIGLAYPTFECCRFPPINLTICFETSCMVSTIFCPSWNTPGCDRYVKINSKKLSVSESKTTKHNFSLYQRKIQCSDVCNCVPRVFLCFSTDNLLFGFMCLTKQHLTN